MEYLYETHMHVSEVSACATSTAREQVYSYKEHGYTGIIVTDHFVNGNCTVAPELPWDVKMQQFLSGYEDAKKAGESCGLDVFLGWEYSLSGLDFLTYGLDMDFLLSHPGMDTLKIEDYSALVRSCGGYIAQAHPYRSAWYIEHSGPVDRRLLDGVEAFNSMDSFKSNEDARKFAKRHNLPMQAGSDSHSAAHERYSGIILNRRAVDIFDIINAIKSGDADLIDNSI